LGLRSLKDDFLLDKVFVFVRADPGRTSAESWWVFVVTNSVVSVGGTQNLVSQGSGGSRGRSMSNFIKVVVHNFTKVDESVLLDLHFSSLVDLDAGSVDDTQVTHVVFAVLANNHQLRFPKFLIVGDLVLICFTFSDFIKTIVAIERDAQVFDLFSVNSFKLQVQLVSGRGVRNRVERLTLEVNTACNLRRGQLTKSESGESLEGSEHSELRVGLNGEASWESRNKYIGAGELTGVLLNLVAEGAESSGLSRLNNLLNSIADHGAVVLEGEHEVGLLGARLELGQGVHVELGHAVDLAHFAQGSEEVVSGDSGLALEPGEPEGLSGGVAQVGADLASQVVVHDVLEVHLVEVVGPGVQHREALVLDALAAVLHDVFLNEGEVSLVGAHGVGEVVFSDNLLGVTNEGANGLDARARLQILVLNLLVKSSNEALVLGHTDGLEDADEHLLEALQVPVLVDGSVDNARGENLLRLGSEQVDKVVQRVHLGEVVDIFGEVVGEELFAKKVHGASEGLGQLDVLASVPEG